MKTEEFEEQAAAYAAGAMTSRERQAFEAYLEGASPEERGLAADLIATASLLPLALDPRIPPARVKDGLMQKIAAAPSGLRRSSAAAPDARAAAGIRRRRWGAWVAAACAVAAVGAILVYANLMSRIELQQSEIVALRDELKQKEELLTVLGSRRISIVLMDGLEVNPVGYGRVFWDPDRRAAVLQVGGLPPEPADKDYQLWVIEGGRPVSAGVFSVEASTPQFFKIGGLVQAEPKDVAAFAITLEPRGGVPSPTGPMYLKGAPSL